MQSYRYSLLAALFLAWCSMFSVPPTWAAVQEQPLIDVLQSDVPSKAEKAITCKKLAIWGTAKAVPSLAALLPDPELTSWARIALEAIPDPAAGAALRAAMEKTTGRTLIGVINSIGVRRDAKAVDGLIQRLQETDTGVAAAAAVALGRVGNPTAAAALRQALTDTAGTVRSAVAEGCILCAEKRLASGKEDQAARLYDEVRAADLPRQRIVEATRGAILARGAEGIPLLLQQLQSTDPAMASIGLMTARELSGPGVAKKLLAALGDLAVNRQALLIRALADRGDADLMPAMLKVAQNGPDAVRIAALEALQSLGDASCVTVLLHLATGHDQQVGKAARKTLETLPGEDVDLDLASHLDHARGAERLVLLELVGLRRIDAVPLLLKGVDDPDAKVRAAALLALGEVARLGNVSELIARVVHPAHAEDVPAALKGLQAACVRMPDREACAQKLATALATAPEASKGAILETLAAMGGKTALRTVRAAAHSKDVPLQDTATRLLGSWMTVDAGPALLELATASGSPYQVRALRGYIRLVRQFRMPAAQRVAMCRQAWAVAQRDAERKLVLQVIQRYPSMDMLRLAVEAAQTPSVKENATAVATAVARKIGGKTGAGKLLEQLRQKPVKQKPAKQKPAKQKPAKVKPAKVKITPDVVYGHKFGMALTLDVFQPEDHANGAGVLFMVSGGWFSRWAPAEKMEGFTRPLTDKGFTVFVVRHGSSPKYALPEIVQDVRRSVRFVRLHAKEYGVDPNRLGVYGMSAGGHLALLLGTASDQGDANSKDPVLRVNDRVQAVVAWVPPTDLRTLVWKAPESLPVYKNFPALDLPIDEAAKVSPLMHVTPDDPPTLVLSGAKDKLVPIQQSKKIRAAFEAKHVPNKLLVYENSGHGFQKEDRQKAMAEMVAWFEKYLNGKPKAKP